MDIKLGIKRKQDLIVTDDVTASSYGSGLVDVFATPAMIALMESTCQLSVREFLNEGDMTVGTLVNVKHLKATPVGMRVECESELTFQDGRRLVFKVSANDERGLIGEGIHERFIVNREEFMHKLNSTK